MLFEESKTVYFGFCRKISPKKLQFLTKSLLGTVERLKVFQSIFVMNLSLTIHINDMEISKTF